MPESTGLIIAPLVLGQTVAAYQFVMPSLREVRQASKTDKTMRGDVHMGQIAAASLTLGTAAVLANLSGSNLPFIIAGAVAAILAVLYELALNTQNLLEA